METRNFALCALGLAAAISFGGAETASAQAKSQKRIPVRKEAPPAEVVAKPDTVRIVSVETVTVRSRPDTVTIRTRPDTVIKMEMIPLKRLAKLFGGSAPVFSLRRTALTIIRNAALMDRRMSVTTSTTARSAFVSMVTTVWQTTARPTALFARTRRWDARC